LKLHALSKRLEMRFGPREAMLRRLPARDFASQRVVDSSDLCRATPHFSLKLTPKFQASFAHALQIRLKKRCDRQSQYNPQAKRS
jgi:hypothetical protein